VASLAHTADLLQLLGEPTRVRLLTLLAAEEMTVADLAAATDLGQSRVSMHLGKLREARVVSDRKSGVATYYSLNERGMTAGIRRIWELVQAEVDDATLEKDRQRWEALSRSRDRAAAWPDAVAGQMERHYSPGRTWESLARGLVGLLALGDVVDAGAGDGAVAQLLAPRSKSYTLVDRNEKLLAAAGQRLAGQANVRLIHDDLAKLSLPPSSADLVLLLNVLVEIDDPAPVLARLAGVLRPGGRLLLVSLDAHEHAEIAAAYRHVHQGYHPAAIRKLLGRAGLEVESCEVTSREHRAPKLNVVTAIARKKIT
jgi:DNA-binding transcriptional ArsR family regulator